MRIPVNKLRIYESEKRSDRQRIVLLCFDCIHLDIISSIFDVNTERKFIY